ncbi:MAG: DNA polymerase III subunit beta [Candidatus Harrisonbacteria bacterium CG10_big_fil_rev_8_21_14_0_10_42_17]|uniref:Beta sliding clamp n=1 Tax=Candidatus Harrisonbacteria bacterium CG10_big_fil_rev_8_21_14_0_10_42_17 TaxID=1974584 RepID=A0A2M6WIV5_9BACT|nr:MAG: DNA polymerase III subunit beta [Candidatus Harrisonbacteria bacterium CG10_big_fil_rev_8_21_14_0_10_42_17]
MKLIILRTNLKVGLSFLERAIGDSSNLPILKHVLLRADTHNKLHLSATNLELGISGFIPCKVQEQGSITIPFGTLHDVISHSDSDRISIELQGTTLIVKTDNYQAQIQGSPASDFPIIPTIQDKQSVFEFNISSLRESLTEVISAAQISEIRPELSGVLFDYQVSLLRLVATDSFRLAQKILPDSSWKSSTQESRRFIIPLKAIQEVIRVFSEGETVQLFIDQNQALFTSDDRELITRLIDGSYPDIDPIIPSSFETEISLDREMFMNALRLVSSFSGKTNDVRLRVSEGSKALELYSSHQSVGENNYLIPAKINGSSFSDLVFNWRYLLDGLKVQQSPTVVFGINGQTKPALLKTPGSQTSFYIVMPIRNE